VTGRVVWVLLALALAGRVAFVAATPDYRPIHDDYDYDRLACSMVQGNGYAAYGPWPTKRSCGTPAHDPRPTAFRAPLWPATLAGVYAVSERFTSHRWTVGRIANALLGAVAVALMGFVAGRMWGRRVGVLALGLGATCLPLIAIGGSLLTETLFTVWVLAAIAATVVAVGSPHRVRWALLVGVLVGAAALTRTNGLVLVPALGLALWGPSPRKAWRALAPAAVMVTVAAVTIVPWTLRNAEALDGFLPVSTETGSALIGTYNASVQNPPNHARTAALGPRALRPPGGRSWHWPKLVAELRPLLRHRMPEPARQRQLVDAALDYIGDHPTAPFATVATNTGRFFGLGGPAWWRYSARTADMPESAADLSMAWIALAAPFVLIGIAAAMRRGPAWLWLVPVLLLLSATVVVGEIRFRAPIDPFLVLLAALGADAVLTWLRRPAGATSRPPSPASASGRGLPSPSGS
jgi:4-amino-4-deoxy-L-arabinose transferase-like glycosyltransferase